LGVHIKLEPFRSFAALVSEESTEYTVGGADPIVTMFF